MAYADLSDVRVYDRELGPDDDVAEWVDTLLGQAEVMLGDEFDLAALVAAGRLTQIVQVESEMVAGVTRNPQAYSSSSEGIGGLSESRTFLPDVAAGLLVVTDRHRGMVAGTPSGSGSSGGAFTIRPGGRGPRL